MKCAASVGHFHVPVNRRTAKRRADTAYDSADAYVGPVGISWLQRWLVTRGQLFRKEPYLPEYMRQFDHDHSGSDFETL